jgi:hypothetical protein
MGFAYELKRVNRGCADFDRQMKVSAFNVCPLVASITYQITGIDITTGVNDYS